MSIKTRARWFLIHLTRGDIEAGSPERAALYVIVAALLTGFLLLAGNPALDAWADTNHGIARVSRGAG